MKLWRYKIKVTRVLDGDTVDARVDLGFKVHFNVRIRFNGINTPETRTRDREEKQKGLAAKARCKQLLNDAEFVVLESHGVGKFGRCLGTIWINGETNLTQQLIDEGHGVPYYGGKR